MHMSLVHLIAPRRAAFVVGLLVVHAGAFAIVRAQQATSRTAVTDAADALCGKEVVVLGELPSHGEARTFQAKAQIIERLVKSCHFTAVLFEAPLYDFVGFQTAVTAGSATPAQLDRAVGRFWSPRELADWRGWLFEQATRSRLTIGGLDDQLSATSEFARATLPGLVARFLPSRNASECQQAVERNAYYRYDATHPFDDAEQLRLQQCTRQAADSIRAGRDVQRASSDQMMLGNLAGYAARQHNAPDAPDRDEVMARNVVWYKAHLPAGSKVVIWTATVHAARQQGALTTIPLGARLAERFGDRLAVVGFTALGGQSSMAGRPSKALADLPAGSLEEKVTSRDTSWVLLRKPALERLGSVPSRLLGRVVVADWSKYFDLVLAIGQETAPVFDQSR